jgi:hypothetical protein
LAQAFLAQGRRRSTAPTRDCFRSGKAGADPVFKRFAVTQGKPWPLGVNFRQGLVSGIAERRGEVLAASIAMKFDLHENLPDFQQVTR